MSNYAWFQTPSMRLMQFILITFIAVSTALTSDLSTGNLFGLKRIQSKLRCQESRQTHHYSTREATPTSEHDVKPCFYKSPDGEWKQRTQLKDLVHGQLVVGRKISTSDLLEAKTGPKVFFEVGVGRIDTRGNWQIVNSMLRLGKKYSKPSVIKKKAGRLAGKPVELYVSKVCLDTCRLEVTLSLEEQLAIDENITKISASSLKPGEELVGKVVQVRPYGVIIDVGANRDGLLHIQKVADLFGKYIDKQDGLEESGLERGATVKVTVQSNERKRLFLDFTDETKALAAQERQGVPAVSEKTSEEENMVDLDDEEPTQYNEYDISDDEAAAWAAYGSDDFEDDYDEDADIEDALGIGSY